MKTELTRDESRQLVHLGVPKSRASRMYWRELCDSYGRPHKPGTYGYTQEGICDLAHVPVRFGMTTYLKEPIFTHRDLMRLIPQTLCLGDREFKFDLHQNDWTELWCALYVGDGRTLWVCAHTEPINALFEMILWLIDRGWLTRENMSEDESAIK